MARGEIRPEEIHNKTEVVCAGDGRALSNHKRVDAAWLPLDSLSFRLWSCQVLVTWVVPCESSRLTKK